MKLDVTRDVVSDLWALCRSGEASTDSRKLVDAFLAEDTSFATALRESLGLPRAMPSMQLSADAERRLLDEARARARMKLLIIGGAVAIVGVGMLAALAGALVMMFRTTG